MLPSIQPSVALAGEIGFWGQAVLLAPSGLHAALKVGFEPDQHDLKELKTIIDPFRRALFFQRVDWERIPPIAPDLRNVADSLRRVPETPYMEVANTIAFGSDLRFAKTKDVLAKVAAITRYPNPFYTLGIPLVSALFQFAGEMESAALAYQNLGDAWMRAGQIEQARQAYHKEAAVRLRASEDYSKEMDAMEGRDNALQIYWLAVRRVHQLRLAKEAYLREESREGLKEITRCIQEAERKAEYFQMRAMFFTD